MAVFNDVIGDYSDGATGTITTPGGKNVSYKVASNARTIDWSTGKGGAQINQDSGFVSVEFSEAVDNVAIFVSSANQGEQYEVSIDGAPVDLNALIDKGLATYHTFDTAQTIDANGLLTSASNGYGETSVLQFHFAFKHVGVAGDKSGGGWDYFDIGFAGEDLPCFCAGTLIETPEGPRPVEAIRAGDMVSTRDAGPRRVLWAGGRYCSRAELQTFPKRRPVRISAGALGRGLPEQTMWVSRQHRILVCTSGKGEVLIPAIRLTELPGVTVDAGLGPVMYHHLLLAEHALLTTYGLESESLFFGKTTMDVLAQTETGLLAQLAPQDRAAVRQMTHVRPVLQRACSVAAVLAQISPGKIRPERGAVVAQGRPHRRCRGGQPGHPESVAMDACAGP